MNIFYLDDDIQKCVEYHCDKHVVKMIVEYAQILSTTSTLYGSIIQGYKPTHKNHPCVLWCAQSQENWLYLRSLALALCNEYTHRYGKVHKTEIVIKNLKPPILPSIGFKKPPRCMPIEFKKDSVSDSYREYYVKAKAKFCRWTNRPVPKWFEQNAYQRVY